jgi:REP element-mobilizing transposase RayT
MAIAFFSTWTTYGTWLPGDIRGWYQSGRGPQEPDAQRHFEASLLSSESPIILDLEERRIVEMTITEHCAIRNWTLHAVNCRSNHVHVAVTAPDRLIELPREQFKAWCTRRLCQSVRERGEGTTTRKKWWTERGWDEYIDTEEALAKVVAYIIEGQGRDQSG